MFDEDVGTTMTTEQDPSFDTVEVTDHLWIPMPDGVRLAARLWLPRAAHRAPVPALLEYIPYRKTDMVRARDERNHPYFAEHGYACLRVDMRGSGDSEGRMGDMYSDLELADARDAIAWIAAQPWCNGRVGMFGTSWGGTAALQANVDAPEALKAVIAVCATHDRYEDDIHHMGGCLLTDSIEWGATLPVILGSPPTPNVGDDWRERWEERLKALTFPLDAWIREEARGVYWRRGSVIHQAERLTCPILAIGGWSDRYSNSVMSLLSARPDLVWGVIGPWGHHYPDHGRPGPAIGFQQVALDWWDAWLKDPDPTPPNWPRLRVWLSEFDPPVDQIERRNGRWIETGPLASQVRTDVWHVGTNGLVQSPSEAHEWTVPLDLRVGQASGDTGYFGRQGGEPLDQREDDALSLTFDTAPLVEDCSLLGSGEANLRVPIRSRGQITLRLNDVAPDGTSSRIVWTVRNLALNERFDKAFRADQTDVRDVRITFPTKAYRLKEGHRLRLSISASYWPLIWPSARSDTLRILSGTLRLPVLRETPADLGHKLPPALTLPLEQRHHMMASSPLVRIAHAERDGAFVSGWHQPYTEVWHVETEAAFGFETQATYRIVPEDPLSAESTIIHHAVYRRSDGIAKVHCTVSARSDGGCYQVAGHLIAEWNGELVADRGWDSSIPRELG